MDRVFLNLRKHFICYCFRLTLSDRRNRLIGFWKFCISVWKHDIWICCLICHVNLLILVISLSARGYFFILLIDVGLTPDCLFLNRLLNRLDSLLGNILLFLHVELGLYNILIEVRNRLLSWFLGLWFRLRRWGFMRNRHYLSIWGRKNCKFIVFLWLLLYHFLLISFWYFLLSLYIYLLLNLRLSLLLNKNCLGRSLLDYCLSVVLHDGLRSLLVLLNLRLPLQLNWRLRLCNFCRLSLYLRRYSHLSLNNCLCLCFSSGFIFNASIEDFGGWLGILEVYSILVGLSFNSIRHNTSLRLNLDLSLRYSNHFLLLRSWYLLPILNSLTEMLKRSCILYFSGLGYFLIYIFCL